MTATDRDALHQRNLAYLARRRQQRDRLKAGLSTRSPAEEKRLARKLAQRTQEAALLAAPRPQAHGRFTAAPPAPLEPSAAPSTLKALRKKFDTYRNWARAAAKNAGHLLSPLTLTVREAEAAILGTARCKRCTQTLTLQCPGTPTFSGALWEVNQETVKPCPAKGGKPE